MSRITISRFSIPLTPSSPHLQKYSDISRPFVLLHNVNLMKKISLTVLLTSIRNKKPSLPLVQPSAARPSLHQMIRCLPPPSQEGFSFIWILPLNLFFWETFESRLGWSNLDEDSNCMSEILKVSFVNHPPSVLQSIQ